MKWIWVSLSFIFLLFVNVSPASAQSDTNTVEKRLEAVVSSISDQKELNDGGVKRKYQKLELLITSEEKKGEKIIVENGKVPVINTVEYQQGDKVSISVTKDPQGKDAYFVTDHIRRGSLYWLFGVFIVLALIIGGMRGAFSIIGMVISFLIIFLFLLPQILAGRDPILIAIVSAIAIIPITFYLSHGINKKTSSAVLGTLISLVITGALANFFVNFAHLTGFASEDATFLEAARQGTIQMKGLLLAGIIIGALGVLDDITVSQSAIVFQLKKASPTLKIWELYSKAMDIGRDHIASMVNTLILVYTGAALPLLLLFINSPRPFGEIINFELVAEEIVRTLVVSIGLILAVPIVTLIASIASEIEVKRAAREILTSLK